eukprot:Nk52_evm1s532 gene=Nk52_evmTU1s532
MKAFDKKYPHFTVLLKNTIKSLSRLVDIFFQEAALDLREHQMKLREEELPSRTAHPFPVLRLPMLKPSLPNQPPTEFEVFQKKLIDHIAAASKDMLRERMAMAEILAPDMSRAFKASQKIIVEEIKSLKESVEAVQREKAVSVGSSDETKKSMQQALKKFLLFLNKALEKHISPTIHESMLEAQAKLDEEWDAISSAHEGRADDNVVEGDRGSAPTATRKRGRPPKGTWDLKAGYSFSQTSCSGIVKEWYCGVKVNDVLVKPPVIEVEGVKCDRNYRRRKALVETALPLFVSINPQCGPQDLDLKKRLVTAKILDEKIMK